MLKRNLTEEVKAKAIELGADLVGIANVERWKNAPERLSPQGHLPSARSVIVMGIHHPDASVEFAGEPNANYPGPFQQGMIPKLDTMSYRIARFLETKGYRILPLPCTGYWYHREFKEIKREHSGNFSHMHAAVAAGLGEFGWHTMFMSPRYGPRERLVSVITDAPLTPDPLYDGPQLCDKCNQCIEHCAGGGLKNDLWPPGKSIVQIEGKTYEYAKMNRWNCFWGEQAHLNVMQKPKHITEETIYQAFASGMPHIGGYCADCLRFCMSKPIRRWDKNYSPAPRRKKEISTLSREEKLKLLYRLAVDCGADCWAIIPLNKISDAEINLYKGYPWEKVKKLFPWVIALGRRLPTENKNLNPSNASMLKSSVVSRLSIGIMDLCRVIDDWGDEAMQMWKGILPLAASALEQFGLAGEDIIYDGLFASSKFKELKEELNYVSK